MLFAIVFLFKNLFKVVVGKDVVLKDFNKITDEFFEKYFKNKGENSNG